MLQIQDLPSRMVWTGEDFTLLALTRIFLEITDDNVLLMDKCFHIILSSPACWK